jgi:hypothetical protein
VDDHDHDEEDEPTGKGTSATSKARRIKKQTNSNRTEHLRRPVDHAVQGAGADVEKGAVESVELYEA